MKKVFYFLTIIIISAACASENKSTQNTNQLNVSVQDKSTDPADLISTVKQMEVIDKPFDHLDVDFTTYPCNSKKENIIHHPTGTQIIIPKDAFVDKNGDPVKGEVDINYREFHEIDDIILSGIKMNTPDGDFESAGMFEIRAIKDGEELELKPGKTVEVEMASFKKGNFNNYVMNEKTKEWEFINQTAATPNKRKEEKISAIDSSEMALEEPCDFVPDEFTVNDDVFDLDYSLNRHYEMKFFNGAMWKLVGDDTEKTKFRNDRKHYNEMTLEPADSCKTFTLTMWNRTDVVTDKDKTKYTVVPVWQGKALDRAKVDFKNRLAEYKNTAIRLAQERRAAEREADLIRKFELEGMGIYNCDRILDFVESVPLELVLKCDEEVHSWWYITMNKKVAIKYYHTNPDNFRYNPNSTNSILAVLPNDKVAMVTNEQFKTAYDNYRYSDDPDKKLELDLQVEPEPVAEKKDFKRHFSRF